MEKTINTEQVVSVEYRKMKKDNNVKFLKELRFLGIRVREAGFYKKYYGLIHDPKEWEYIIKDNEAFFPATLTIRMSDGTAEVRKYERNEGAINAYEVLCSRIPNKLNIVD